MLTRLSVRNFKSIREAEVRFGPLTCFLGHNGAGKSNLFDAIHFLGALAERDIGDAAAEVRRTDGGISSLDLIFRRDPDRIQHAEPLGVGHSRRRRDRSVQADRSGSASDG